MWAESGGGADKEKKELDGPNGTAESPNNATAQHVPNQPSSSFSSFSFWGWMTFQIPVLIISK